MPNTIRGFEIDGSSGAGSETLNAGSNANCLVLLDLFEVRVDHPMVMP